MSPLRIEGVVLPEVNEKYTGSTVTSAPSARGNTAILGTTIFLSAFLLFSLEPLLAKKILPWFGGSAAVWSTCLVFYQIALLLGYLYARLLTRFRPFTQAAIHISLLLISVASLPIGPSQLWRKGALQDPTWVVLGMLTATVGLPFCILSATSPLLQDWLARGGHKSPYRLFSLSNLASLTALLSFPVVIEPALGIHAQSVIWSSLYVAFVALCSLSAWRTRAGAAKQKVEAQAETSISRKAHWLALAACGSMLLLSVTNHICKNVAALPLLWVLPLAIYLVTFILSFGGDRLKGHNVWLTWLVPALLALSFSISNISFSEGLLLPVFLTGLFVCCMFCHSELSRLRPPASDLTEFYLILSLGGAVGAIFVGIAAPRVFEGIYELPLSLVFTAILALSATWFGNSWSRRLLWTGVTIITLLVFRANVSAYHESVLAIERSFYGSLRVIQAGDGEKNDNIALFNGTIKHGVQFAEPTLRSRPTAYYGRDSGIGLLLDRCIRGPKRVGIVGLGAGTIAAYGEPADVFRFYEINRQVIDLARSQFTFLKDTPAKVEISEGDARLSLEREAVQPYDVLILDAFSGDSIPAHLLTKEAVALYQKHLKPEGALAFHLTNRYLDLPPVVRQLADTIGYRMIVIKDSGSARNLTFASVWAIVTNNDRILQNPFLTARLSGINVRPGLRVWTDDYNNLFQVLKMQHASSSPR